VGFVVAMTIVVTALGAVSEIVLPMTFAAVLAVVFRPLVGTLGRYRFKPSLAAGLVVLGLLALDQAPGRASTVLHLEVEDRRPPSWSSPVENRSERHGRWSDVIRRLGCSHAHHPERVNE
jgi:hypothetical protein